MKATKTVLTIALSLAAAAAVSKPLDTVAGLEDRLSRLSAVQQSEWSACEGQTGAVRPTAETAQGEAGARMIARYKAQIDACLYASRGIDASVAE